MKSILHKTLNSLNDQELAHVAKTCNNILDERREARLKDPETLIKDVRLRTRTFNALKAIGIEKVKDIGNFTRRQIRGQRNLGKIALHEIEETMSMYGITYSEYN